MPERMTMTVREAAKELGICDKVCYNLTHRADFPSYKIGHRTVVSREGLREWVRTQATKKEDVAV